MDELQVCVVWDIYEKKVSIEGSWMWARRNKTLQEVKQGLLDYVRENLGIPIHEAYTKFWTGKNRPTFLWLPEYPFEKWAVPLDESTTTLSEFFDRENPLYMESTLPRERYGSYNSAKRKELVERISDVYGFLVNTQAPFCAGTCPVSADKCLVRYRSTDSDALKEINLSKASEEELEQLTKACKPASFGRNNQDVYDESYRKAWKMDGGNYLLNFNVEDTDIINTIKSQLVRLDREICVELYKLNVYGKGSFFKTHKDTPRTNEMFGSLVVVFPIAHEGGIFTLHHHEQEWNVDFSKMLSEAEQPSVGFVAFYSDIDHEVKEVTSGYRVTFTYILTFAPSTQPNTRDAKPLNEENAKLAQCIEDISAMDPFQYGGYLAFGLLYQYPVSDRGSVASLRTCLKGQDAVLGEIMDRLGLPWNLRVYYRSEVEQSRTKHFLSQHVVQFGPYANITEGFSALLPDAEYVIIMDDHPFESIPRESHSAYLHDLVQPRKLVPLTPIPRFPQKPTKFVGFVYGNEAWPGRLYVDVCLVADVPPEIPGTEKPSRLAVVEVRGEDIFDDIEE